MEKEKNTLVPITTETTEKSGFSFWGFDLFFWIILLFLLFSGGFSFFALGNKENK